MFRSSTAPDTTESSGSRSTQYFTKIEDAGVPQNVYLHWIKSQLDHENACLELPVTILLLVSFSFLATMHLNQDLTYSVEQGMEMDVIDNANFAFAHYFGHKDIFDVHSFADFWSWVRLGFLPLVIQNGWLYSEEYSADAAAAYENQRAVGRRMQQSAATPWQRAPLQPATAWPPPLRSRRLETGAYDVEAGGYRADDAEAGGYDAEAGGQSNVTTSTGAEAESATDGQSSNASDADTSTGGQSNAETSTSAEADPANDGQYSNASNAETSTDGQSDVGAATGGQLPPKTSWMFSEYGADQEKPVPIRGDYLKYNRIIGGIRFRQQVATASSESCIYPGTASREAWDKWYGKPCMPAWEELAFLPTAQDAESFDRPERVEWIYTLFDDLDTSLAKAVDMEDGCQQLPAKQRNGCLCKWCAKQEPEPRPWLDETTQRIEISFAAYNPNYGMVTLTGVNFFINRGGYIQKRVEVMSSWVDPMARPILQLIFLISCDALWIGLLLYIFVLEVKEIFSVARSGGKHWHTALWNDYIAFWNVVDWISFSTAVIIVLQFVQLQNSSSGMMVHLRALIEAELSGHVSKEVYAQLVDTYYGALWDLIGNEKQFRLSLCLYPMMVMMRLFKSFAAQPRLAVVTDTLVLGTNDMLHFFLVFTSVLGCLCLDSVILFGQDLQDFATFPRAFHTCFRMMFGDWDWEPMQQIRRTHSYAWFCIFLLIVVLILFNIVLAIVMESYMAVKNRTANAVTLQRQIKEMWRRHRQFRKKERVRLNDIYDAFVKEAREMGQSEKEMLQQKRLITASFLETHVEGIPPNQAQRTLKNAWEKETKPDEDIKLEDSELPLHELERTTKLVRDDLYYIYERAQFFDTQAIATPASEMDREVTKKEEKEARRQAVDGIKDPPQGLITQELLEFMNNEIGRLSSETASILAQTMRRVDKRQAHIELRQNDMLASVHDLQETLQKLQAEAYMVATRMQRNVFNYSRLPASGSNWRGNLQGNSVPYCFPSS